MSTYYSLIKPKKTWNQFKDDLSQGKIKGLSKVENDRSDEDHFPVSYKGSEPLWLHHYEGGGIDFTRYAWNENIKPPADKVLEYFDCDYEDEHTAWERFCKEPINESEWIFYPNLPSEDTNKPGEISELPF